MVSGVSGPAISMGAAVEAKGQPVPWPAGRYGRSLGLAFAHGEGCGGFGRRAEAVLPRDSRTPAVKELDRFVAAQAERPRGFRQREALQEGQEQDLSLGRGQHGDAVADGLARVGLSTLAGHRFGSGPELVQEGQYSRMGIDAEPFGIGGGDVEAGLDEDVAARDRACEIVGVAPQPRHQ